MTNYLIPLLTCLISILLFHLLLIKNFPQGKRFWKKVDYWWVSVGVLGVLGSSFAFRKEYSTVQQPFHKQSLLAVFDQYEYSITSQYHSFNDSTGFNYKLFDDISQAQKYVSSGIFFNSQLNKTSFFRTKIIDKEQYNYIDTLSIPFKNFMDTINNQYISESSRLIDFMVDRMKQEGDILLELKNGTERNFIDWFLLYLSPFLIAFAIAIRLTKVTAELRDL